MTPSENDFAVSGPREHDEEARKLSCLSLRFFKSNNGMSKMRTPTAPQRNSNIPVEGSLSCLAIPSKQKIDSVSA